MSKLTNFGSRLIAEAIQEPDDGEEESEDDSGEVQLWKLLPQLKEVPEHILKKLPLSAMFQLNHALSKEKKNTEKLGTNSKLARNVVKVSRNPATVEKGKDNCKDILHPARFLGGASCSLTDQWIEARRNIGE